MAYDLNDMMVFLAVVETGSFTLAADKLGMPKANVSRKVSRLEKQLNITLLERSTRSQHLTEAGKRYVVHCKRIHEEADLATACVSELLHSYRGDLKIGASVSTGQQILRPALASFMHEYPDINVQLSLTNRRVDLIEEGFDMLIRIGELNDSMLIAKKLGSFTRSLYVSPRYVEEYGIPTDIEDLDNHAILMNSVTNDLSLTLVSNNNEKHVITAKPRLVVDDFSIMKQSIVDGVGIGVMPQYMCKESVNNGTLIQILPTWGLPPVDAFALYPRNRSKIPKVNAFLQFVIKLYQNALN